MNDLDDYKLPVKFDAAFIERRMRQHRDWQKRKAEKDEGEIVGEVLSALDRAKKLVLANRKRFPARTAGELKQWKGGRGELTKSRRAGNNRRSGIGSIPRPPYKPL